MGSRDWLETYLDERRFVERVMERIHLLQSRPRKAAAWGIFCLLDLALLVCLGADPTFLASYFALQAQLSQFFFLFLGITFVGGLIGLVLCLDTSWLAHLRIEHPRRRQV